MFLYNFLLLITLYLLKPVRDSLFLVELGPDQLPFVFIMTAVAVVPISMGYSRFSDRISLGWVINGVTLFLSINLLVIWWLINIDSAFLYYLLYVWVSIYSILITSQFWLLANALFNPMQAKRIFTLLSLAAIVGAIAGGEITGFLIDFLHVAPQTLLLIGGGLLLSTIGLVQAIRWEAGKTPVEGRSVEEPQPVDKAGVGRLPIKDILQSRHLMLIIGIIAISVIATTIIDYQFKTVASEVFSTDNSLTTFMGRFYGRVSILALLLQLFLSSQFIERKGVGGAVTLLPSILLLGSAGLFVWPGLVAAVLLRGADQSLKHSLDRTGRELLFVPVEINLKKRTKVFIDLFVDNGAQGLAGILLLFLTYQLAISVQYISLVVIALLICWIILAVWVRRSYINEFRESVEKQVNHQSDRRLPDREVSVEQLVEDLQSQDGHTVWMALKRLEEDFDLQQVPLRVLERLLGHPNPEVRERCLHLFRSREIDGYIQEIVRLLEDPNVDVRLEAARYIYHFYDSEKYEGSWQEVLKDGLWHQDLKIRAATLGLITKDGGPQERALITTDLLEEALRKEGDGARELRVETARALEVVFDESRSHLLAALLDDPAPEVVKQAIISAGRTGERKFIHILLDYLHSDQYKSAAQQGLAMYGERIFGTLFDYLSDEQVALAKRLQIPPILYYNSSQVALDVLQLALDQSNMPVRHQIIKAMNKIRQQISGPVFDKEKLKDCVHEEARRYALLKQSYALLETSGPGHPELLAMLDEETAKSFENIFRLLGLIYDADDIYNVYKGIRSDKNTLISESIEFLDNLIEWELKRYLMPLFESLLSRENDYGRFENQIGTMKEAVDFLLGLPHPILREKIAEKKPELPEGQGISTDNPA